jgi:putative hydrolase of the HAD superfamily
VSFDIGNTLLRLPHPGGFCAHFSRTTGIAFDTLKPLFAQYFLTRDLPIREAVTRACAEIDYPDPNHVVDSYTPPAGLAFDDVVPTLTRLRAAGVSVIAVGNCAPWDSGGIAATGLAPLLDEVFCSFQIGAAKPDPRIFRHVQTAIGAKPEEILHLGDTPTADVQGATSAGWSALLLDRNASRSAARQNRRTRMIRSLADLVVGE